MGYCGLKIPGHTGTDFKHKKVFTKPKEILNHKRKITNVKIEPREQDRSHAWFLKFKVCISVLSIGIIFLLISFFASRINNVAIHRTHLSAVYLKSIEDNEKKEAAELMYNSAKLYYDSGSFDSAQEEITRVLTIYPRNLEALTLMHKILTKQCEIHDKFCRDANDYKEYLASNNNLQ